MSFDFKRYLRDYCRNPGKTTHDALRGEYKERRVTMNKQMLLRFARGIAEEGDIIDQWLACPQTRLSPQARSSAGELNARGWTEAYASVESEIERCFSSFCREFEIRRRRRQKTPESTVAEPAGRE